MSAQNVTSDAMSRIKDAKAISAKLATLLSNSVLTQLENDIVGARLTINDNQKILHFDKNQNEQKSHTDKLNEIIQKKQLVEKQLADIMSQQLRMKKNSLPILNGAAKPHFRSQMTEDDKQNLKRIMHAQRRFEKELQLKTLAFQQKSKRHKQQREQLEEKQRMEKCQQRREEIEKHLEQINRRHAERQAKLEQEQRRIQQLNKKRHLYEDMEVRWKKEREQQEKQRQQLKEQAKKINTINFGDIKQHQRKYEEVLRRQRQERQKKHSEFNQMYESRRSGRYSPSTFFHYIAQEGQKKKEQDEQRKKLPRANTEKRLAYADKIRKTYKFKSIQKIQQDDKPKIQNRSLSGVQTYQKGNDYMRQVHSGISTIQIQRSKVSDPQEQTAFKYKDYLKEGKMGRTANADSLQKTHRELDEIKRIMKKQNDSQEQKFYKAKLVAQRIEERAGSKSKNLVDSINAKIQILKELQ